MDIFRSDRAQFMLLAGFIISIGLVTTTVMLNNIIFESNMAGETGSDHIKYDIVNLIRITGDEMKSAYRNVTASGQNPALKFTNFTRQMQNFNGNLTHIYAMYGEGVIITWNISNWNSASPRYANFTDNGTTKGAVNWTVMENVKTIYVFELRNVSGSNFMINVSNQTTGAFLWTMNLIGNNQITITNQSGGPYTYSVSYSNITLLNSSYSLSSSTGSNTLKIAFLFGSNASGRFNITGKTNYGMNFTRARDHNLNATIVLSTSDVRVNITVPVSVPW